MAVTEGLLDGTTMQFMVEVSLDEAGDLIVQAVEDVADPAGPDGELLYRKGDEVFLEDQYIYKAEELLKT